MEHNDEQWGETRGHGLWDPQELWILERRGYSWYSVVMLRVTLRFTSGGIELRVLKKENFLNHENEHLDV